VPGSKGKGIAMHDLQLCLLMDAGWRWDGEKLVHPRHKAMWAPRLAYGDSSKEQELTHTLMNDVREARRLNVIGRFNVAGQVIAALAVTALYFLVLIVVATTPATNTSWQLTVLLAGAVVFIAGWCG
jgi:hypothetical protein